MRVCTAARPSRHSAMWASCLSSGLFIIMLRTLRSSSGGQILPKRADRPRLRFHDLRDAFGSLLATQAAHRCVTMELMGHSQFAVTMQVKLAGGLPLSLVQFSASRSLTRLSRPREAIAAAQDGLVLVAAAK
jgi:hypothetical protein